nr:macrophage mannose receptor 1-like [Cherax quadricarinatus]
MVKVTPDLVLAGPLVSVTPRPLANVTPRPLANVTPRRLEALDTRRLANVTPRPLVNVTPRQLESFRHQTSGQHHTQTTGQHSGDRIVTVLCATSGLTDRTYWIDVSDQDSEGDWRTSSGLSIPMGTPFWKADTEFQEPNNVKNYENCLEMNNKYSFFMNDIGCSDLLSLICEQPPQDTANHNMTAVAAVPEVQDYPSFVSVGGLCLSFMTWVEESWEESRQACHGLSGELAAVTDIEQLRAIYLYLHQEGIAGHSFWLGGSDTAQEGVWLWTDGQRVPMGAPFWGYVKSYVLEPQGGRAENCLLLSYDGFHYFRDYSCSLLRTPLCMYAQ